MVRTLKRTAPRRGFTLIELLVVIAIIGILVSMTAVAVFRTIGATQGSLTKAGLTKFDLLFQKQYSAAATKYSNEPIPTTGAMNSAYYNVVLPMANKDAERARVIWTKLRLRQTFPNNFNEALNPAPLPPLPDYKTKLESLGYSAATPLPPQPWESAVCLLMALERSEEGGGVSRETLGVNSYIGDFGPTPNNQTVQGLVDGWHKPLAFCRWPILSTKLNPAGPQAGPNNDTSDPRGLLASTAWQGTAGYGQFKALCHDVPAHANGSEAKSYRIYPLIVSPGPDGKLGLDPITFQTLPGNDAADNLYPTLAPAS